MRGMNNPYNRCPRKPCGDLIMDQARRLVPLSLWVSIVLLAACAGRAAADNVDNARDEALRKKALAFNNLTGDDPIKGQIKELIDDTDGTKKLLKVAVAMSKEKPQPFNYNAAYVLARAAGIADDLEAGKTFYRICAAEATKLKSGEKLAQSFNGLISILYAQKKFDECEKD